jgi:23S rRNA pseudouridine1911/1915/1917 synthase
VVSERTFEVEAAAAGERLDRWLAQHVEGVGRRGATELCANRQVLVNGRSAPKSHRLAAGDVVGLLEDPGAGIEPEPDAPLDVRLERADLVVVDKPAGQATAPLAADERGSLAGALVARYPEMRGTGYRPREPGLLHRLDTQTSGLVLAARTAECFSALSEALAAERLQKRYLALVEDRDLPAAGEVELALTVYPRGSGRVIVDPDEPQGPRARRSVFRTLERRGGLALVSVSVERAFRHQVRVHLSEMGWPIVGDQMYGGRMAPALGERHALHASYVAWAGDARVPAFTVESALPEDLAAFFRSVATGSS